MGWLGSLVRRRKRRQEALDQIIHAHRKMASKDSGRREVNVDYGVELEPVEGANAPFRTASDGSRSKSEERTGLIPQTSILANKNMPDEIEEDAGHWYTDNEFVRDLPEDVYSVALMTRIHRKRVAFVCGCAWLIGFVGLLLVRPALAPRAHRFPPPTAYVSRHVVQSLKEQLRQGLQLPITVTGSVRMGQFVALALASMSVHEDILNSAVELGSHLLKIFDKQNNPYAANRFHVIVVLLMRLSVGILSLASATVVIITSDELLAIFSG